MSARAPSCRSRPTIPPTTGCTPNGAGSTQATADRLNAARAAGGRLIAVGTTSLRLIESAAGEDGTIQPFEGDTAIFITPGYRFKAVDGLMTNFHLPRSTLFMLVSALMGLDVMKAAYAHAIARRLSLLQLRRRELAAAALGLSAVFDSAARPFSRARPDPVTFDSRSARHGSWIASSRRHDEDDHSSGCLALWPVILFRMAKQSACVSGRWSAAAGFGSVRPSFRGCEISRRHAPCGSAKRTLHSRWQPTDCRRRVCCSKSVPCQAQPGSASCRYASGHDRSSNRTMWARSLATIADALADPDHVGPSSGRSGVHQPAFLGRARREQRRGP